MSQEIENFDLRITDLFPDSAARANCLHLLIESIIKADKGGEKRAVWSVTQSKDFIRLNVGAIEVLALLGKKSKKIIHFVLDKTKYDKTLHQILNNLGATCSGREYSRVPGSITWDIPYDRLNIILPVITEPYFSLIDKAIKSVNKRTPYYKNHSSLIIEYLRKTYCVEHLPNSCYDI